MLRLYLRRGMIVLIFVVATIGPGALISTSDSFGQCIKDRKHAEPYKSLHEERSLFIKTVTRTKLSIACGRLTASQNDGAVIALSTIVVAAFTFALWQSTEKLWNATMIMARHTERALIELERPFVFAEVTKKGVGITTYPPQGAHKFSTGSPEITWFNLGRTPAILTRLEYVFDIAEQGGIISPINPKRIGGRELPVGTVSDRDRPYQESENLRMRFTPEQQASLDRMRASMWVTGFIRYRDIFGKNHITGFTQVYDPIGDRWVARGDERYNYAYTEKEAEIPPPSSRG